MRGSRGSRWGREKRYRKCGAFTWVELLGVIVLIGVFVVIAQALFARAREEGRTAAEANFGTP